MADESTSDRAARSRSGVIRATGRRRKRRTARQRALRITAWTVAGGLLVGGAGLGYVYVKLNGNISGVDINAALGPDRPEDIPNGSLDILVLGSDSRSGDNAKYGQDEGGARSDTAMIVHIYEDHKSASVVSIPRDTLVDRPACEASEAREAREAREGGSVPPARRAMFNESYQLGGPACAVKTVESMTGIRMDHYMEVDFTGFEELIDTLGGVEITTTKAIHDKSSHLNLDPGTHTLGGEQALGLVRTRKGVGDGSDLGRIQLQQAFVKALIDQIKNVGVLSNPKKLLDLADTGTSALTTDSDLASVNSLTGLAKVLRGIGSDDINMVTLPVAYDQNDPNRVVPLPAQSRQVWQALRADQPIPESATKDSAGEETDAHGLVR
ncbi:LCP family protein [Streptomyces gobiensis]|uniref:LCP family protein n=1 Tax=Streptomyces gobiensis TaxID=2875706 RepID=UPI001E427C6D|nr:LCP family protein [Streptomyces gobiensis]UGY93650.1 LCP family protein [Streptomyces gobiensis]